MTYLLFGLPTASSAVCYNDAVRMRRLNELLSLKWLLIVCEIYSFSSVNCYYGFRNWNI